MKLSLLLGVKWSENTAEVLQQNNQFLLHENNGFA